MEKIDPTQSIIGIIVPCYNEEEILPATREQLGDLLKDLIKRKKISSSSFIALVDDGSRDKTWELIQEYAEESGSHFRGVKLSRNFGHQSALVAGLQSFVEKADCLISIDADLQDDIRVIEDMIDKYYEGFHIVYGVRKQRNTDTFFKRTTAKSFYKLMQVLGVDIVYNHADYRLSSRQVMQNFMDFREVNLFLRGIFPLVGFPSTEVYYDRLERTAGESKYPLRKMMAFAFDGISSFSIKPLRMVTIIGFVVFIISLGMAAYSLLSYFVIGAVPGWTSITLPIYFISGIQILCIGILGEYLGKIYKEVKCRPRYIIEKIL